MSMMAAEEGGNSKPAVPGTANIVGLVIGVTLAVMVSTLAIIGVIQFLKKRKAVSGPQSGIDNPVQEQTA